ncbi:MAG: hypothetical protein H0X69_05745 [Gemmatimonadales bacterium]|nr:hypothetical protein [Gemmatimonadales bacterium]
MSAPGPELSVILPTDTYATVANELAALRAQTVREQLEIVIVTGSAVGLGPENGTCDGFHSVTVVEVEHLYPLSRARARGVQAAAAPIVLLAESHAYLERRHCEALIRAHQGSWAVVGPAMWNANPATMRSWAGLYLDYGPWVEVSRSGAAEVLPGHNSSYKRSVLLEYGDQLESMMKSSPRRHADLLSRGHRLYLEPGARTYHLNVSLPWSWLEERLVGGRSYAAARSLHWSTARRLVYGAASPLIPAVRVGRVLRDMRRTQSAAFILRSLPALGVSLLVSAIGEGLGYLFGAGGATHRVNEMEVHKERYVRAADNPAVTGVVSGG